MIKKIIFISVIVAFFFGLSVAYSVENKNEKVGIIQKIKNAYNDFKKNQDKKSQPVPKANTSLPAAQPAKPVPEKKEMTREDMLSELNKDLPVNEEVFDMVPGLKAEKGADGKAFYTFNGKKLEELSKEDLSGVFVKARQALVRIRTDRIQRQLDTVKQADNLRRISNAPQSPRIPSTPKVATNVPSAPPSVAKSPSLPPVPPKR